MIPGDVRDCPHRNCPSVRCAVCASRLHGRKPGRCLSRAFSCCSRLSSSSLFRRSTFFCGTLSSHVLDPRQVAAARGLSNCGAGVHPISLVAESLLKTTRHTESIQLLSPAFAFAFSFRLSFALTSAFFLFSFLDLSFLPLSPISFSLVNNLLRRAVARTLCLALHDSQTLEILGSRCPAPGFLSRQSG